MNLFSHEALSLEGTRELVYTAMSKHYFYFRMHISRFVLDQGKVPLNPLLRYFLLFLICIMGAECGAEETWKGELIHTEYVHPIDDDSNIPLPFVKLKGKIIQHTFPGVPNYESIEDGDAPETRWVLVIPETEIQG